MALPIALPLFVAGLVATVGAKFLKEWVEKNTLFPWEEIEEKLRPLFTSAGLTDLSLRPEGPGALLRFVVRRFGARVPVHLLLHADELQLDRKVKLRLALLAASFGKGERLYDKLVIALVSLIFRFRGGLAEEVLRVAEEKLGGERRENAVTFDLTGLPQIQSLLRKGESIPGVRELDLSWLMRCEALAIGEEGLRVYLLPSHAVEKLFSTAKLVWPLIVPPMGAKGAPGRK